MIFNAHQYFLDVRQRQMQRQDISLRKQVATVLGIGEATVVTEQNKKKMKNSQLKKIWVGQKMNLTIVYKESSDDILLVESDDDLGI